MKFHEKFSKVDFKEDQGEFYTRGYIATTHIDRAKDMCTKETLDHWAKEINTNSTKAGPVSIHHDRDDMNLAALGVEAGVEELQDGQYGLFVETHHNKAHPDFKDTEYQVKNNFLTHYSIEYNTQDDATTHRENVDGSWVRVLEPETELLGYGFASPRTVVNENANIKDAGYKEIIKINPTKVGNKEVKKMQTKEDEPKAPIEEPKAEAPAEEAAPAAEEAKAEEKPEESAPAEEAKPEEKEIKAEVKAEVKEQIKNEIMAELKETKPEGSPMLNKQDKIENKEKVEFKELAEYKEALEKSPISSQWAQAKKLEIAMKEKGVEFKPTDKHASFEIKENKIEYKDLTTDSNYVGAQTTYVDALTNYEQTPAELNDIYGPVIINQMNNITATWNLLPKDNMSTMSAIRFRARTAANTTAGFYAYGSTPGWDSHVTRRKLNLHFVTAYVEVAVEDEEIELARANGGIGDIFGNEIQFSTLDLMDKINQDLLQTATSPSESQPYTFETTIVTGGSTLYGRTVNAAGYTTLAAAGKDDMSSAPITLQKMREMLDTVRANGAKDDSLAFICHYTQRRKILTLIQSIQRTVPTSARVGFTGVPELDGIPIHADKDANTDDLFLIDLKHTRIGLKKAPSFVEFGKTQLRRQGIIWMMYNLYSTAPNHNYWIHTLQTT